MKSGDDDPEQEGLRQFCNLLVCLAMMVTPLGKNGKPKGPPYLRAFPGMVIDVDGHILWLSAGHIAQEIRDALTKRQVRIDDCSLIDWYGDRATSRTQIPFPLLEQDQHWEFKRPLGLDYWFVALRPMDTRLLAANGISPITEKTRYPDREPKCSMYAGLGLPLEAVKSVTMETIQGGFTVLGDLNPTLLHIRVPRRFETSVRWFRGTAPKREVIESIVGMSGGPIIGISANGRYWVVGIQSWWNNRTRVVYAMRMKDIFAKFRNLKLIAESEQSKTMT